MTYAVPTGRKDGRVSKASDCNNLPSYMDSVDVLKKKFAEKGLDTQDLVTLSGNYLILLRLKAQFWIENGSLGAYLWTICLHKVRY